MAYLALGFPDKLYASGVAHPVFLSRKWEASGARKAKLILKAVGSDGLALRATIGTPKRCHFFLLVRFLSAILWHIRHVR